MIFICGAPRSGTTLLGNLLDGHPGVSVIPNETHIQNLLGSEQVDYFERDYLFHPDCTMFYDKNSRNEYRSAIKNSFGIEDISNGDLDLKEFFKNYAGDYNRFNKIESLYIKYAKATMGEDYNESKVLVEKRPLDNEINALKIKKNISNAKFIHILRDPRTRYVSIKSKRLKRRKFLPNKSRDDSNFPFFVLHPLISMVSFKLAQLNKLILKEDYLIIKYEDLVSDQKRIISDVSKFIKVCDHPTLYEQTHNRKPINGNSSFKNVSAKIEDIHNNRLKKYYNMSSDLERKILHLLTEEISSYFHYDLNNKGYHLNRFDILKNVKNEPILNYIKNRLFLYKNLYGNNTYKKKYLLYMDVIRSLCSRCSITD